MRFCSAASPAGTEATTCKGCPATVYWIVTPKNARLLVSCSLDVECRHPTSEIKGVGVSHFVDCPAANTFNKSSRMQPGRRR